MTFKRGDIVTYVGRGNFPGKLGESYEIDIVYCGGQRISLVSHDGIWFACNFVLKTARTYTDSSWRETAANYFEELRKTELARLLKPDEFVKEFSQKPSYTNSDSTANPKAAYGMSKPSLALIPGSALLDMAGVFELGAQKYGDYNWRETKVGAATYINAALRHILSWFDGQDIDPESSRSHLAHAAACCAIVIDAAHCGQLIDDRPPKGATADRIKELTKPLSP